MRLGYFNLAGAFLFAFGGFAGQAEAMPAPARAAPAEKSDALPGGSSEAFRDRMTSWASARLPATTTVETLTGTTAERLYVSSPFGWRSDPIKGVRRRHAGIDLPGPARTLIHATGAGVVRVAGRSGGYGNLVEIEHAGGIRTRYGHLSRILVRPGSTVGQGQVIGQMGSTGRSTGTHLHYEVRVNGVPVNPLEYIGQTVPRYQTMWAPDQAVTPRWAGWADTTGGKSLPGARIR